MMLTGMCKNVFREVCHGDIFCKYVLDTLLWRASIAYGVSRHSASFSSKVSYDLNDGHAVMDTHFFFVYKPVSITFLPY